MSAGLVELRAAASVLASTDPGELSPVALGDQVVLLRQLIDGLEGIWSRMVGVLDGTGSIDGGTAAWLRTACRLSPAAARARVVLSRRLAERPAVAGALVAGEISVDHARLVTRALDELADAGSPALAAGTEAPILIAARRTDPARLRREIDHARHALIAEAALDADEVVHRRRHLDIVSTFDGAVAVHGILDAEAGETLRTALGPLSGPSGPDDTRSAGQRRADALAELARRQLDTGTLPVAGGERPHVTVLVPNGALSRLAGPAGAETVSGAETVWGAVLAPETARRIACDASVTRVIVDAESQPLDVGRRTRIVPPALRTALVVRDRGCAHPGCDRPPSWTDAHHVRHWADGGETSLNNLVLLCRTHHRTVHEGRSSLSRGPTGRWRIVPTDRAGPAARRTA